VARIVRTDRELELPKVDAALRAAGHELVLLPENTSEEELAREAREATLLLMCYTPITRRVIEGAEKLKGIVKYGVGIDAIDIDAARSRGIPVANVPEYAEETVAEGAFALMMALAKKHKSIQFEMTQVGWAWPEPRWLASDLAGKTVGIVGLGRIGSSFARMATAFRMRVLAFDPYVKGTAGDLRAMLAECDFVSIHCVLNAETRHLIGESELRAMKPSAFLINVSRGAIVDEMALLKILLEKKIAGAALDVYSQEPLAREGHPLSALYAMDNVILSPHLTFYTHEAMARLEAETLERCREVLEGRPLTVKSRDPRLRAQTRGVRFAA
jgi:D-3-phosphoglycerate dehydrogenase / 2-oxoglutarate reductase